MVAERHRHDIRWMSPQPMWQAGAAPERNGAPMRPSLLRFATDEFMDELIAAAGTRPQSLPAWLAQPETWLDPMPAPPAAGLNPAAPQSVTRTRLSALARQVNGAGEGAQVATPASTPLKLYQPAQSRHYLVAASLICQLPGLPDRRIEAAREESARFVMRRIIPPEGAAQIDPDSPANDEYAFVTDGETFSWRRLDTVERTRLQADEERLPLSPLIYDQIGRKRRMMVGAIPVARREAYAGAPITGGPEPDPEDLVPQPSPLQLLFQTQVTSPWRALIEQAEITRQAMREVSQSGDPFSETRATAHALQTQFRERAQTAGWYLLADFAVFLQTYLARIWSRLQGQSVSPGLDSDETALLDEIQAIEMPEDLVTQLTREFAPSDPPESAEYEIASTLADALTRIAEGTNIADLETVETELSLARAIEPDGSFDPETPTADPDWPGFLFLPAHPGAAVTVNSDGTELDNLDIDDDYAFPQLAFPNTEGETRDSAIEMEIERIEALADLIAAALPQTPNGPVPELAPPPARSALAEQPFFVIRCVYERPNCQGFARPIVSRPSAAFQMASFFDPDAPARDIRIPMPLDLSPSALRKYKKGAGFILSDMFCGQFGRFKKMTLGDLIRSVLPWPLHKDLPGAKATPCGGGGNGFGLLVSISIPIVTICAFILMIIMVALFDLIFKWFPYLLTVIRIPGLRGKTP